MEIAAITIGSTEIALIRPYVLSFATLHAFRSNIAAVRLEDGRLGLGEVTALPGYGEETFEEIRTVLQDSAGKLEGCDYSQGMAYLKSIEVRYPFAASCLGTALDLAYHTYAEAGANTISIPMLRGVETECTLAEIEDQLVKAHRAGYGTVKIKVGKDLARDKVIVPQILSLPVDLKFRFDANQGYDYAQAREFISVLEKADPARVELLEQPLGKELWAQVKDLCATTEVPIMLDESIYNRHDIARAAETGCALIKLKLCKTRGLEHLTDLTKYAKSLGLEVVLGNGVATDLANYAEGLAYAQADNHFFGAIESNGFGRITSTCLGNFLEISHGNLVIPPKQPDFDSFIGKLSDYSKKM